MSAQQGKICVVCHEDCSGKPRTKDVHGNYYCRSCYEQRLEMVRQGQVDVASKPSVAPPPVQSDDDLFAIDMSLIESPAATHASATCPTCSAAIPSDAVICLSCGCNVRSGQQMRTQMQMAPKRSGSGAWPIVVGTTSIVFGGCGCLFYSIRMLGAIVSPEVASSSADPAYNAGFSAGYVIGASIPLLLSVWLTLCGVGITMRRPAAVRWLRGWAITKAILACLGGTCLGIGLAAASGSSQYASQFGGADFGSLVWVAFIAFMVWILFWPVFTLMWFGRPKVQSDIERW